jgi:hypothetical protein
VASSAALQQLGSLTRLTTVDLSTTGAAAGLAQLTSLKSLGSLNLSDNEQMTDRHLQPLSALTGLTFVNVRYTIGQGSWLHSPA